MSITNIIYIFRTYWDRCFVKVDKCKKMPYIAMFHNIVSSETEIEDAYTCTVMQFEEYIKNNLNKGFAFVGIDEFLNLPRKDFRKKILLTFDDGFKNVVELALPILERYHIPFIVYVTSSYINQKDYLSDEQLLELCNFPGCDIGLHANQHIQFRNESNETLSNDFDICKQLLEKKTGKEMIHYAFPYGSFTSVSHDNIKCIKNKNVRSIVLTRKRCVRYKLLKSPFMLPRINVPADLEF